MTDQTIGGLETTFRSFGHVPSTDMWTAIRAVARCLEDQANGEAPDSIFVSSLDPGVGKTQTVVQFLRVLLASPQHEDVAVIVCVSRRAQIKAIVRDAGLDRSDFAVLTTPTPDENLNDLGRPDREMARVLFTTHQMVLKRSAGRDFGEVEDFQYRGQPREVRIWDEAILPGECLTVSEYQVAALLDPLSRLSPGLAADLKCLFLTIDETANGSIIELPSLSDQHGISEAAAVAALQEKSRDGHAAAVRQLWSLFGRSVTVRKDGATRTTVLDYKETLPNGVGPLLVLDASARLRHTYALWEDERGGIVRLPSATKDYANLTIHVWDRGGGKDSFRKHGSELIDAIVSTILRKPDERWLVIHHKNVTERPFGEHVRGLLPPSAQVEFLHWGAHDATNEFADIPNVILAGTLYYPASYHEALGRLCAARPSSTGPFGSDELRRVELGEHRNLILQSICRGAIRKSINGGCPPTDAYIIASARSGIRASLSEVFPGSSVVSWRPKGRVLSGKVKAAVEYLEERFAEDPTADVLANDVMRAIGITDHPNFRRTIMKHVEFGPALADRGIEIVTSGRQRAFSYGSGWFLEEEECCAEKSESTLEDSA
ncbi:MAG: hypothetical protein IT189_11020 [Microbacteriaceae bacterium]|nr:hypothetical protein [Microbacteriaceae bacterium]